MDLTTKYMGLTLRHPFVSGASPLVDDMDMVRRLEDAGTAAIVMHSLFEEQILMEQNATIAALEPNEESFSEARSFLPESAQFRIGPHHYLEQIRRLKAAVAVPVIASLNGVTPGGWLHYAKLCEAAGADGLELNFYQVSHPRNDTAAVVEERLLRMVGMLKAELRIPLAVKVSPFFSNLANVADGLDAQGADALVLFNRFYQPDIEIEELEVLPSLRLSDSSELLLRLRWLATLYGRVRASLACTGGVHTVVDAIKALMAGADSVQMVSALLSNGPEHLQRIRRELEEWLVQHEYTALSQLRGSMSLDRCPDPAAFERANYLRVLQSWRS